jgi:hypothetical protein
VGLVVFRKGEASREVLLHKGGLVGLEVLHDGGVDRLLQSNALSGHNLLLGSFGEEGLGVSVLLGVVADEHLVAHLGHVDTGNVDLGGGGDGVDLVDALNRDAVDLVGASDQKEAGGELLEADDALSTETAGEEDKDGSGDDAGSKLGGRNLLGAHGSLLLVSGVPLELFDH